MQCKADARLETSVDSFGSIGYEDRTLCGAYFSFASAKQHFTELATVRSARAVGRLPFAADDTSRCGQISTCSEISSASSTSMPR
jgi:hypothetical protein